MVQNKEIYLYRIAGRRVEVRVPQGMDLTDRLPSFRPFVGDGPEKTVRGTLLWVDVEAEPADSGETRAADEFRGCCVDTSTNDLGRVTLWQGEGDCYRVDLVPVGGGAVHRLAAEAGFARCTVCLRTDDPRWGEALNSLLRIAFSQALLLHRGVLIHASAVCWQNRAFLFLGRSGTGKSTHAALWQRHLPDCELLNDDNPALVLEEDGKVWVYGTPWSGKTPCYQNRGAEVGGVVRLQQAPHNRFCVLHDVEAFVAVLPGCSVIQRSPGLHEALCATLTQLVERVRVARLECLPDADAVIVCCRGIAPGKDENLGPDGPKMMDKIHN